MSTTTNDPFDLTRFVDAQAHIYATAFAEIRRGRKQSHWMWFIFPQLFGLGTSEMANRYGIRTTDEADAYLAHPLLGDRYRECVKALQDLDQANPELVFGPVDARKLQSSLTLFNKIEPAPLFTAALDRWFGGQLDDRTLSLMNGLSAPNARASMESGQSGR